MTNRMTSALRLFLVHISISSIRLYDLALFTFLIAFSHFVSELLIFRTARLTMAIAYPIIVASESRACHDESAALMAF